MRTTIATGLAALLTSPMGLAQAPATHQPDRSDFLEQQIRGLENRVTTELKAAEIRAETITTANDRSFYVLTALGAIGSLMAGFVIFQARARDQHSRALDKHYANIDRKSLETQTTHGQAIFEAQIESITKLGSVISIFQQLFHMQLTEKATHTKSLEEIQALREALGSFSTSYTQRYVQVQGLMRRFGSFARMRWTELIPSEVVHATRARNLYDSIPSFFLTKQAAEAPYDHAKLLQLLGVAAYYSNDVGAARALLIDSRDTFSSQPARDTDVDARASCLYYLGIIDKNWCPEDVEAHTNLDSALLCLRKSHELTRGKATEMLTPVTLAEILSYSSLDHRKEAVDVLNDIVERSKAIESNKELDKNQRALQVRSHLLLGNISFMVEKFPEALQSYQAATDLNPQYSYSLLSLAQTYDRLGQKEQAITFFQDGLSKLEHSGVLDKPEHSARAIAIAWSVIAVRHLADDERLRKYSELLRVLRTHMESVSGLVPMLFSPLDKRRTSMSDLVGALAPTTGAYSE